MIYLSFDLEATGLAENDLIIEFACVPFSTNPNKFYIEKSFHCHIQCPPFEQIKHKLDEWVIKNNKNLIEKAHRDGLSLVEFKNDFRSYLDDLLENIFAKEKIILFGKSLNAIDLPFLNRDLGWEFMRKYFYHQQLDLSSVVYHHIDLGNLPKECSSGSKLMEYFQLGDVQHTALEDAINTVQLYFEILSKFGPTR